LRVVSDADLDALLAGPRILCIDLERVPGTVTLDVFDAKQRSDYIHASKWDTYPETICFSWRWLDEKRTQFASVWSGEELADLSWSLYDQATHVLGFNSRKADNRWCRDDWLLAGLPEPSPWRDIDLYVVLSQQFALEARSMDYACQRLGLPGKRGHYSISMARAAVAGDEKAQRAMERYNRGDVKATVDLFERIRPLAKFPGLNLGLYYGDGSEHRCSKCGHRGLDAVATDAATPATLYGLYRCRKCQGLTRNANRHGHSPMRGVV
jgi:hypothetical protein